MNLNWTDSVLPSNHQNISMNDLLLDLLIEKWSTKMNYSKYFDQCSPSFCTYTTTDQTNIYYAVTLLISLYGGLTIMLISIVPFLVRVFFSFKCPSRNAPANSGIP